MFVLVRVNIPVISERCDLKNPYSRTTTVTDVWESVMASLNTSESSFQCLVPYKVLIVLAIAKPASHSALEPRRDRYRFLGAASVSVFVPGHQRFDL